MPKKKKSHVAFVFGDADNGTSSTESNPGNVIVLGNRGSGKSALVQNLQRCGMQSFTDAGSIGVTQQNLYSNTGGVCVVDNAYIDVRFIDEKRLQNSEVLARCNLWVLEHSKFRDILLSRLKQANLSRLAVLICLDLSKPWNMMMDLDKWLKVYVDLINSLVRDSPSEAALVSKLEEYINTYRATAMGDNDFMFMKSSSFCAESFSDGRIERLKKNTTLTSDVNDASPADSITDEELEPAPVPTTIVCNLGVPLIVAVLKSDTNPALDNRRTQGYFDVVLAYLRRACLDYGAAIIYTNEQNEHSPCNVKLLYRYLMHRLYEFPFRSRIDLRSKESIFIPSGWDRNEDIESFAASSLAGDMSKPYETIITRSEIELKDALTEQFSDNETVHGSVEYMSRFLESLVESAPSLLAEEAPDSKIQHSEVKKKLQIVGQTPPQKIIMTGNPMHWTASDNPVCYSSKRSEPNATSLQSFFQGLLAKGKSRSPAGFRDRLPGRLRPDAKVEEAGFGTRGSAKSTILNTNDIEKN